MNRSVDKRLNTFQSTRKKQITQHNVSEHNTQ